MALELIYTSAPAGLRQGSRGFCTVACTRGMPPTYLDKLESLSGYRAPDRSESPRGVAPASLAHYRIALGGKRFSLLSRIGLCGVDYTGRVNKIAHHLLLDPQEYSPAGPASLLAHDGLFRKEWSGASRHFDRPRSLPVCVQTSGKAERWEEVTGDAGWAGVLAERCGGSAPVFIVYEPGFDVLPLFAEAQRSLDPDQRWHATFNTYLTQLPPDVSCDWRGCTPQSPALAAARRNRKSLVLDLRQGRKLGRAPDSALVKAAREGSEPPRRALPEIRGSRPIEVASFVPPAVPITRTAQPTAAEDMAVGMEPTPSPARAEAYVPEPRHLRNNGKERVFLGAAGKGAAALATVLVLVCLLLWMQVSRLTNAADLERETQADALNAREKELRDGFAEQVALIERERDQAQARSADLADELKEERAKVGVLGDSLRVGNALRTQLRAERDAIASERDALHKENAELHASTASPGEPSGAEMSALVPDLPMEIRNFALVPIGDVVATRGAESEWDPLPATAKGGQEFRFVLHEQGDVRVSVSSRADDIKVDFDKSGTAKIGRVSGMPTGAYVMKVETGEDLHISLRDGSTGHAWPDFIADIDSIDIVYQERQETHRYHIRPLRKVNLPVIFDAGATSHTVQIPHHWANLRFDSISAEVDSLWSDASFKVDVVGLDVRVTSVFRHRMQCVGTLHSLVRMIEDGRGDEQSHREWYRKFRGLYEDASGALRAFSSMIDHNVVIDELERFDNESSKKEDVNLKNAILRSLGSAIDTLLKMDHQLDADIPVDLLLDGVQFQRVILDVSADSEGQ